MRFRGVLSEAHVTGVEFQHRGGGHSGEYPTDSDLGFQQAPAHPGRGAKRIAQVSFSGGCLLTQAARREQGRPRSD